MTPGHELDVLIAEKIMGAKVRKDRATGKYCEEYEYFEGRDWPKDEPLRRALQSYSTDIAAAWEVVTHVMKTYRRKISIETLRWRNLEY